MFADIQSQLENRQRAGLLRQRAVHDGPQSSRVMLDGKVYLSFASNDYLGLAAHPQLIKAVAESARKNGVGAGASHLITGHHASHHALENALAKFVRLPQALLFSAGYMANLGVVTALLRRGDAVFADKLNHASLNDACLLSRAKFARYPHKDLSALARQLAASKAPRKLVATDAVFSMEGDIAPLPEILALCERYDALLLIDDAHGFGVLGAAGRGVLAHFGLRSPRIVYMATLGKAAGVFGAFVAGEATVIENLMQQARTYIYTTATPPLLADALLYSLHLIEHENWRRAHLDHLRLHLQEKILPLHSSSRWHLLPSDTPIQPLIIGDTAEALRVSAALRERGIWVPAIRPPTVPQGTARLRISLSASHQIEDVKELVAALQEVV